MPPALIHDRLISLMTLMTHCLSKSGNTGKPSTARKALFSWGEGNPSSFDFRGQELQSSSRESLLAFALAPSSWGGWSPLCGPAGEEQPEKEARECQEQQLLEGLWGSWPVLSSHCPLPSPQKPPQVETTQKAA